jgi:pantoate--beta-alanine ligase
LDFIPAFYSTLRIVIPDVILLGEKDLYQNVALKSLINRLGLPIKIVIAPTARDPDGLAFSSRNAFLTKVQRERALSVYKSLQEVAELTSYPPVKELRRKIFNNIKNAHGSVCHVEITCAETMAPLDVVDRPTVVIASATFDKVTVWDNILINA